MTPKDPSTITITVNGTDHNVPKGDLSFDQVVKLDSQLPRGPTIEYSITYEYDQGERPGGILESGSSVKVHKGMMFDVVATDRS